MLRRGLARVSLRPRRRSPRFLQDGRSSLERDGKRRLKRATLRDCSRRCVYCGMALSPETATLDHVHPVARGGSHLPGNLVVACAPCNRLKGDMLPNEFFARNPSAGANFVRYARTVHRGLKRGARRAVSLAMAA